MLSNENLGELGEAAIRAIFLRANISSIKPVPDTNGGDLEIYWPETDKENAPLDERPSTRRAFLQIKSTQTDKRQVSLSLSAANKLVGRAVPSFVIAAVFNDSAEVTDVYAFHVGESWTAYILKRMRQCAEKNKSPNKSTVNFGFSKGVKIPHENSYIGLVSFLERIVPTNVDLYIKKKIDFRLECGFDEQRFRIMFKTPSLPINDLIGGLMGDKPLPMTGIREFETRFGISLPSNKIFKGMDKTEISIEPFVTSEVVASISNDADSVSINGVITATDFLPFEHDGWQFRFYNDLISFIVEPNKSFGRITLDAKKIISVSLDFVFIQS